MPNSLTPLFRINLTKEEIRALKMKATKDDRFLSEVMAEAIRTYLQKEGEDGNGKSDKQ
jgi:hypothetical protein